MACGSRTSFHLSALVCALLVDLSRPASTVPPVQPDYLDQHTGATGSDGAKSLQAEQVKKAGDVKSDTVSSLCRHCRSGHFAPPDSSSRIRLNHGSMAARSRSTDHRSRSLPRRKSRCGGRCQPCSVCPSGNPVVTNCTVTQDTVCSPCPVGYDWDPVTRRCKKVYPFRHEVVVENPSPTLPHGDQNTQPTAGYPAVWLPGNIGTNKIDQEAPPSLTEEARNEQWSAGYLASLFASGAAGITVFILLIVVAIYVWLRLKQWKDQRSISREERCLTVTCFENICRKGSITVSVDDTEYSSLKSHNTATTPASSPQGTAIGVDSRVPESRVSMRTTEGALGNTEIRMEMAVWYPGDDMGASSFAHDLGKVGSPDGGCIKKIRPIIKEIKNCAGSTGELAACKISEECFQPVDRYKGKVQREIAATVKDCDPEKSGCGYTGKPVSSSVQQTCHRLPSSLPPRSSTIITTDAVVHDMSINRPVDEVDLDVIKDSNL